MHAFLAEQYLPNVSGDRVDELARRLLRQGTPDVRLLGLVGLPGDETLLALFAATSPAAVADAVARVDAAPDRIVPAFWHPAAGC